MPKARVKDPNAPRWICPECDTRSLALALRAHDLGKLYGPLLECPACEIGSALDEWKRMEINPCPKPTPT